MRSPDVHEMWGKLVYREILAPEWLVFIVSFSDKECNTLRHFASPTWPLEVMNTLTLSEHECRTTLTVQGIPINATEKERKTFQDGFASMQKGFTGTLDQLEECLAHATKEGGQMTTAVTVRVEKAGNENTLACTINAPPTRVFKAWSDPGQLAQWCGPPSFTNPICQLDLRPGGAYRIVMRSPTGDDYPIKGN